MPIRELTTRRKDDGSLVLCCPACNGRPEEQRSDTYQLGCAACHRILGDWSSAEERAADLTALAEKASVCQCGHMKSDHPHGPCNNLKRSQAAGNENEAMAVSERALCGCKAFNLKTSVSRL